MTTPEPKTKYTYADYCEIPDDQRYELISGALYDMAPAPGARHQTTLLNLGLLFVPFVRKAGLGRVMLAPFDVKFSDEDVLQPDLLFVAAHRRAIITDVACEGAPDLVVEILSPSTSARDRGIKRDTYARFGVREYWVIDARAQTIDILRLDGTEFAHQETLRSGGSATTPLVPGLEVPLEQVFSED